MKPAVHRIGLLALLMLLSGNVLAQTAVINYRNLILGAGLGEAYQSSDIANSSGSAATFFIGTSLAQSEEAFFSLDWKFRFLAGNNMAYDHRINTDGTYSNILYKFQDYDLELGLTLNRLRERTGIVISGFVGAGITHGSTFSDLYGISGNLYDYSIIDPNQSSDDLVRDLKVLSDGVFETSLVNKGSLLPTAGFFLGYRFGPSFSLGIEYKTNFSLTEQNSFVGLDMDNRILSPSAMDRNNYFGLKLGWSLRMNGSGRTSEGAYTPGYESYPVTPVTPANPVTTINNSGTGVALVNIPLPVVRIIDPASDPIYTDEDSYVIRASVANIQGAYYINFYQNGMANYTFAWDAETGIFTARVRLAEGDNSFRITAMNQKGEAEDAVHISKNAPRRISIPLPEAVFVSPAERHTVSPTERTGVAAHVANVYSIDDIEVLLNGRSIVFEYNADNGMVHAGALLAEGDNVFQIFASNESGRAEDRIVIHYEYPIRIAPPTVTFVNPARPVTVEQERFHVLAHTERVFYREDLRMVVNGRPVSNFAFRDNGDVELSLVLQEGQNNIELSASNEAGSVSERTSITYRRQEERVYPPEIQVSYPGSTPFRTYELSIGLRATIRNVETADNLSLTVNGQRSNDFTFDYRTGELRSELSLANGQNAIVISAWNRAGRDSKNVDVLRENRPCQGPSVRLLDQEREQLTTSQKSYPLRAEVRNVRNNNQIRLTVNGTTVPFNFSNEMLTATVPLTSGSNTILLKAWNDCGEDQATARVIYNQEVRPEPCKEPSLYLAVNKVNRQDASHELSGTALEIKNKTGITLLVDGQRDEGFQFVPNTGALSAKFKLNPGKHTIEMIVRNDCGTQRKSVEVTVDQPCTQPKLSFTVNPVDASDATHELRGTIGGVNNSQGITIFVDGRPETNFRYESSTGVLQARLRLNPGAHSVVITVRNDCGSDSKTVSFTMDQPCSAPRITASLSEVDGSDATHTLRGSVSNIKNKTGITVTLDGRQDEGFQFVPNTGTISAKFKLSAGSHTIVVSARNECGSDSKSMQATVQQPCSAPVISISVAEVSGSDATHELRGSVSNIKNKTGITVTVDGRQDEGFQFVPNTGAISAKFKLSPGTHTIVVSARNECGTDSKSRQVTVQQPCKAPTVSMSVSAVNSSDATHELKATITNVANRSGITVLVDGRPEQGLQYVPSTGQLSVRLKLASGSHSIQVSASNECGKDAATQTVQVAEAACGPRFNPGNAAWQFCLVTPSRTYTREDLRSSNFSYSGPASSLYFMPIAGGGDAEVNGKAYSLRPGQYYLFTGSLYVTVSTKNPGSMGQWSVCIRADRAPTYGSGNNRPKSPCETSSEGNGNSGNNGNNGNNGNQGRSVQGSGRN